MSRPVSDRRRVWRAGFAVLAASLALGGCVNFDKTRPLTTVHVLADASPAVANAAIATDPRTLLVLDTVADGYYDSTAIAFSRTPGTLARYQFASWDARPGKRYADLLRRRLADSGAFAVVAQAGGPVRGELLLDTRLMTFHHDAQTEPGVVVVVLDVELIDLKARTQRARTRIDARVPVARFDAAGAAAAFDRATAVSLDQLGVWLAQVSRDEIVVPAPPLAATGTP